LGGEDAEEETALGGEVEACGGAGCRVAGELLDAEAGEEAEGQVEEADEYRGGQVEWACGDAEFGEEPEWGGG